MSIHHYFFLLNTFITQIADPSRDENTVWITSQWPRKLWVAMTWKLTQGFYFDKTFHFRLSWLLERSLFDVKDIRWWSHGGNSNDLTSKTKCYIHINRYTQI